MLNQFFQIHSNDFDKVKRNLKLNDVNIFVCVLIFFITKNIFIVDVKRIIIMLAWKSEHTYSLYKVKGRLCGIDIEGLSVDSNAEATNSIIQFLSQLYIYCSCWCDHSPLTIFIIKYIIIIKF